MGQAKTEIRFPIGRLVEGSLYDAQDKDADGNLKVFKSGPKAGQARIDYFFAVAIPKHGEQSWAQTEWGAKIYQAGITGFPQGQYQQPTFAWKVRDGDSTIPNKKGKAPCTKEGFPGHWVVSFSSGYPPSVLTSKGERELTAAEPKVKPGYFIQVFAYVDGNESLNQPGVYINHSMVAFSYAGPEIQMGRDGAGVGFGGADAVRPAGAIDVTLAANPFQGGLPGQFPGQPQQGMLPPGGFPGQPGAPAGALPGMPQHAAPGAFPGHPGAAPGMLPPGGFPGQPAPGAFPGQPQVAGLPGMPQQFVAATPVAPSAGFMQAPGAGAAPGFPGAPGAPGFPGQPPAPQPAVRSLDDRRMGAGLQFTVAQWAAAGWDEAKLIAAGHLTPY